MNAEVANEVFIAIKKILLPYASEMDVQHDNDENYYLNCRVEIRKGTPLFFAGVRIGKNYVSYHLMPIYMNPRLQATISPALKKHMQGKACFNFKKTDNDLFHELEQLTAAGARFFTSEDCLKMFRPKKSP